MVGGSPDLENTGADGPRWLPARSSPPDSSPPVFKVTTHRSYKTRLRSPRIEAPQGQGLGTSISVLLGTARSQELGRCSQIDGRLPSTVLPA